MAGVSQVWLTDKEIIALLHAAMNRTTTVSDRLLDAGLRDKMLTAIQGTACTVKPAKTAEEQAAEEEKKYGLCCGDCTRCPGVVRPPREPEIFDGSWN